jgi:Ca2+-binding RTX toxin-like protein
MNIEKLRGSWHGDVLTGNDGKNQLSGSSGNDTLFGGGGHDILWGDQDNDALQGGAGDDHLDGGDGIDSADYSDSSVGVIVALASGDGYLGTAAGDTLTAIENVAGSADDDLLVGDGKANTLWGQVGNDTLKGGGGADQLNGGTGSDTASYEGSAEGVTVDLSADTAHSGDAQGDELNGIENVTGSGESDYLTGDGNNNTLTGLGDHDLLVGLSGADTLLGGIGNDSLYGGDDADTLDGGSGIDTAWYSSSPGGVTVNLMAGIGSGYDAEDDTLTGIENVTGSAYADNLQGNDDANTLVGGDGVDTLKGGGGADHLFGGKGNDQLIGGAGADTMKGGKDNDTYSVDQAADVVTEAVGEGTLDRVKTSTTYSLAAGSEVEVLETSKANGVTAMDLVGNEFGNTIVGNDGQNTIVGGLGLDTMTGSGGADVFVWTAITEMGSMVGADSDTIGSDFNAQIGDLIALNPIDADGNAGNGDTAFTFIGDASNPFTAAGQVSWFNNGPGTDTYILLNTDGNAAANGVIRVLGVHAVDASWFVL